MLTLGIESSCDETAASVSRDGREILSNVVLSQVDMHAVYGGVVPEIASRSHVEGIHGVVSRALADASVTLADIDAIAVTYAPGLIGALLVGVNFAKGLAFASGKPLIPVHHIRGHISANYIAFPALKPPFTCLVVSGGHSLIADVRNYTDMAILGSTRDDAAGEAFDKAARVLGLPYPGGAQIDRLAAEGDPRAYPLPRAKVEGAPWDFFLLRPENRGSQHCKPRRAKGRNARPSRARGVLLPRRRGRACAARHRRGRTVRPRYSGRRRRRRREFFPAPRARGGLRQARPAALRPARLPLRRQRRHDRLPGLL